MLLKHKLNKTCIIGLLISCVSNVNAMTLSDALVRTYEISDQIKSMQNAYLSSTTDVAGEIADILLPDISIQYSKSASDPAKILEASYNSSNPFQSPAASKYLVISKKIFTGFSSVSKLAIGKLEKDIAKSELQKNEQKFILDCVKAYNRYITTKQTLETADKYVEAAQKHYDASVAKIKLGEASKIDVVQSELKLLAAKSQLLKARSEEKSSHGAFKVQFGFEPDVNGISDTEIIGHVPANYDEFYNYAIQNNSDYKMLNAKLKQQDLAKRASFSNFLPELSMDLQRDLTRADNDGSPYFGAKMTFAVKLLSHGQEYLAVRKQKYTYRASIYSINQNKNVVQQSIKDYWENYLLAEKNFELYRQQAHVAEITLDAIKSNYDVGLKAFIDVLDAEQDLFKIKLDLINARSQFIEAVYNLKSTGGELTVKALGLKVKNFDPDIEYNKEKIKIIGF